MRRIALAASLALAAAPALAVAAAVAAEEEGVAVTVYSTPGGFDPNNVQNAIDPLTGQWAPVIPGFSIVKERRKIPLAAGRNAVRFEDVAARIDGSTVTFKSLTDPAGTSVLEQAFEYDLASADRILEKHVGQNIRVVLNGGTVHEGRLVSFDPGQVVLQGEQGLQSIGRGQVQTIGYPKLPEGLVVKPTLVWAIQAGKAGEHLAEVAYETSGMSWAADYTAIISPDETKVDLSAWVTIRNQSGASYRNAGLKLVAGDLNRAPKNPNYPMGARAAMEEKSMDGGGGFAEKSFFEYHMYTLGRRTTIPDRSLKQIELFDPVAGAPCRKVYLYDGLRDFPPWYGGGQPNQDQSFGSACNRKVGVFLEVENRKENGMGMPLPAGRMRIHKRDEADGFPELIGEDRIDHTPKDETVRLKVGDAFDIVGERSQSDFACDWNAHWIRETVEIRIRNHKAQDVEVLVAERMHRWVNWTFEKKSHEFVKKDAQLVHFPVKVPKDGETVLTYTVKYTW